jgi:hypothetical protein
MLGLAASLALLLLTAATALCLPVYWLGSLETNEASAAEERSQQAAASAQADRGRNPSESGERKPSGQAFEGGASRRGRICPALRESVPHRELDARNIGPNRGRTRDLGNVPHGQ